MQTPESSRVTPAADALDAAFESLKVYNWGMDTKVLHPIEDAAVSVLGDPAARKALEARLVAALEADVSRDAKDVVCRMLRKMGSADSVPALARLLPDKDLSHMARYALERIQDAAAGDALRDALPRVAGQLKAGVAGSLGARRDAAAVPSLIDLLGDEDAGIDEEVGCLVAHARFRFPKSWRWSRMAEFRAWKSRML